MHDQLHRLGPRDRHAGADGAHARHGRLHRWSGLRRRASSTARSSSTAACSRSSPRWRPAPSLSASRSFIRPMPGGDVDSRPVADLRHRPSALGRTSCRQSARLLLVLIVVLLVWVPFRTLGARPRLLCRRLGRGRGLHVRRRRSTAPSSRPIRWPAVRCAVAGLILTFQTYSGEAERAQAGTYTLNSIAAVVIGGTSLFGGSGGGDRLDLRRLRCCARSQPSVRVRHAAARGSRCSRASCCCSR